MLELHLPIMALMLPLAMLMYLIGVLCNNSRIVNNNSRDNGVINPCAESPDTLGTHGEIAQTIQIPLNSMGILEVI